MLGTGLHVGEEESDGYGAVWPRSGSRTADRCVPSADFITNHGGNGP